MDKEKMNILVTGCEGEFGLNIGRILKMDNNVDMLVGTDIVPQNISSIAFDEHEVIEKANHKNYFQSLSYVVKKYNIQLIIPTSEAEIEVFLNKNYLKEFEGVPLILPNKKSIEVGLDKLKTAEFLKENKLKYPWTKLAKEDPDEIPCIMKPRFSQGSKNVFVIEKELINYYRKKYPDSVWQELLLPDDQEYTCGLYRTKQQEVRTIVFRRKLQGGSTGSGEVVNSPNIDKLLVDMAEALDLHGSINVQLRLTKKGPVVFEINPRFSSTVMFRHLLGFRDVVWSIEEVCGKKLSSYTPPTVGTKIFKGAHEYIFPPTVVE